jgi:hypothetical protein
VISRAVSRTDGNRSHQSCKWSSEPIHTHDRPGNDRHRLACAHGADRRSVPRSEPRRPGPAATLIPTYASAGPPHGLAPATHRHPSRRTPFTARPAHTVARHSSPRAFLRALAEDNDGAGRKRSGHLSGKSALRVGCALVSSDRPVKMSMNHS